jgi:hypothetical protein
MLPVRLDLANQRGPFCSAERRQRRGLRICRFGMPVALGSTAGRRSQRSPSVLSQSTSGKPRDCPY